MNRPSDALRRAWRVTRQALAAATAMLLPLSLVACQACQPAPAEADPTTASAKIVPPAASWTVESARDPFALEQVVGAARELDTPSLTGDAYASAPAAAFDGTNYLVVWDDVLGIHATRVGVDGAPLDPSGITVAPPGVGGYSAVAFDGTNYLVVWHDRRNYPDHAIYGARVTPAGEVLDPEGIAISTQVRYPNSPAGFQARPAVAPRAGGWLVVWADSRNAADEEERRSRSDIYGARVDADGAVLDAEGIAISSDPGVNAVGPAVAFDGVNDLVAWVSSGPDGALARVARVGAGGQLVDPGGVALGPSYGEVSLAFGGEAYLVAWTGPSLGILAARVSTSAAVLDPGGVPLFPTGMFPAAGFDGVHWWVAWYDYSGSYQVVGARLDAGGALLGTTTGIGSATGIAGIFGPALSCASGTCLTAWVETRVTTDVYGGRLVSDGSVLDAEGVRLTNVTRAADQYFASAAFDGANFLAVWEEYRAEGSLIRAVRVGPAGEVLDAEPITLDDGGGVQPAVAFDGERYLVVWQLGDELYGVRVGKSGRVLDAAPFLIATGVEWPSLAFDGESFLLVFKRARVMWPEPIVGVRVSSAGVVLDPGRLVTATPNLTGARPTVASGGDSSLVVWSVDGEIQAARVARDGTVLDENPITVSPVTYPAEGLSAAFGGGVYLVTWQQYDPDGPATIRGARVTPSGEALDPQALLLGSGVTASAWRNTTVAFDGRNFVVAWSRSSESGVDGEPRMARLSAYGDLLDPTPAPLFEGPAGDLKLTRGPAGQLLLGYRIYAEGWRARIRTLGGGTPVDVQQAWPRRCLLRRGHELVGLELLGEPGLRVEDVVTSSMALDGIGVATWGPRHVPLASYADVDHDRDRDLLAAFRTAPAANDASLATFSARLKDGTSLVGPVRICPAR